MPEIVDARIIIRLFFEKITQINELADATKIPVLGGLPLLKNFDQILSVKIKSKDNFVESLRAIKITITYPHQRNSIYIISG